MNRSALIWGLLALLLAVTALAYWPGTRGAFLLDDYPNLVQNQALKDLKPTPGSFLAASFSSDSGPSHRPIAMASFALNVLADGGAAHLQQDASAMKWTNVLIHLLNGLLVFVLLRLLLGQYRLLRPDTSPRLCDGIALIVTAAWLLAPINLTAVLYVIQRMTSLAATFSLLGLIAYTAGRNRLYAGKDTVRGWLLLGLAALVCTPLSILSKEIGALTMLYAGMIEFSLFGLRDKNGARQWPIAAYFTAFLLVPAIIGLCWLVPGVLNPAAWQMRDFTLGERLLTEGRVIWHYIWWSLVPNIGALTLFHDAFPVSRGLLHPWSTLPAWLGIALLLTGAIAARRRYPLASLGILWFLAGQAITASFVPLELVFEHREYLPSLGLYLALFGSILALTARHHYRRLAIASLSALIVLYGAALGLRSMNWSNPLRQLAIATHDHPDSPRATYAYGRMLTILAGIDPKLTPKAFKALQTAQVVPRQGILPDATLIILAHQSKRPVKDQWYKTMIERLSTQPIQAGDEDALYSLVHCALRKKNPCKLDPMQMQMVFATALTHSPDNTGITVIYGNYLLNVARQPKAARNIFNFLVKRHPDVASYRFDLGVTELACGDLSSAESQLGTLRKLNTLGMSNQQIKSLSDLIVRFKSSHGS